MLRLDVALGILVERTGQADEAGMLARAVVVQGGGGKAVPRKLPRRLVVRRPMRAAFQAAGVAPRLGQHARRRLRMQGLAAVRRAGQRDFGRREAEAVRGATLEQRQGLERLHGRAREHRPVDIAERKHDGSVGIEHGDRAFMDGFDDAATCHFGQNRIAHERIVSAGTV